MSIYLITVGTTGIGADTSKTLLSQGHEVFNIDHKGGDFIADLSKPEDRQAAIDEVFRRYPDGIDSLICNAGVSPIAPAETIISVNFFAPIVLAQGLRPLLKLKTGNCVITSSNSSTNMTVRPDWVDMLSNVMDEKRALEIAKTIPKEKGPSCYSSSKHALARWVRRVSASWATDHLRINSVAPGNIATPMTECMTPQQREAALLIPIPTRYHTKEFQDAQEVANSIVFLAAPLASGINGVILFVDGGIDALLRSERF